MPLESLGDPERINVKQFDEEHFETAPVLPFDPERDISDEDWEKMKQQLEEDILKESDPDLAVGGDYIAAQAAALLLLFPERASELGVDENLWTLINTTESDTVSMENASQGNYIDRAEYLGHLKILFPTKMRPNYEGEWIGMLGKLHEVEDFEAWPQFMSLAAWMKVYAPELFQEVHINEQAKEGIQVYVKETLQKPIATQNLMELKILFPEMVSALTSESFWQNAKMFARRDGQRIPWLFAELKIIAAKEIRITNEGVEIIMPERESFEKPEVPIPEVRAF